MFPDLMNRQAIISCREAQGKFPDKHSSRLLLGVVEINSVPDGAALEKEDFL